MYDTTETRILELIYLNPGIHKRELSKQLKLGMPSIDYGLKKINRIIKQKSSGNQINYFLDYSKEELTPLLNAVEHSRLQNLPAKVKLSISDLLRELRDKPIIALIFGSYAKGDHTRNSDIDVLLVFQEVRDHKMIENTSKRIGMKTNTRLNPVYLGYKEFAESFHNPTKEFFRRLRKDKIILVGAEWWRQLEHEEA